MSYEKPKLNPPVEVETSVFDGVPEGVKFWIGKTSQNGEIFMPNEEAAAHRLCAETYHSVGIMTAEELAAKDKSSEAGQETSRFAVLSRGSGASPDTVMATMKTICRPTSDHPPLPIEEMFPDVFSGSNRTVGNLEISKTASRHPDKTVQNLAFIAIIRASFIEAVALGSKEMYCATEEYVSKVVSDIGTPYTALITEPRPFDEMGDEPSMLLPLLYSVTEILSLYRSGDISPVISMYLAGMEDHRGLGFFGSDLINPLE